MNYEIVKKEIGQRIKELRKKHKESQATLAKAINVSQDSISKIENGAMSLTLENQLRISKHYNVSHDYLCAGIDNENILENLTKHLNLKYNNLQTDVDDFRYPVLEISEILMRYMIQIARAKSESYLPNEIRDNWIKTERSQFLENIYQGNWGKLITLVPVPEELVYPDDQKAEWSQTDLLRIIDKKL